MMVAGEPEQTGNGSSALIRLLRVDRILTPAPVAANELLIADGRVAALGRDLPVPTGWPVEVIDAPGLTAVPAFIDQHVHVTGGGGEGGCGTRCPPLTAATVAANGIGTVVGVLGTDGISRTPADLLAGVRGLQAAGLSAWMYTGSYRVPPPTLTGDIQRDLAWVPEVLGVGEIALSDHRSSQPRFDEIARLVADARVGGMLAGKRGICHFHIGDGERGLALLHELLASTEIPADQVIPTHVNRRRGLLEEAVAFSLRHGASVDVTAFDDAPGDDEHSAYHAVQYLLAAGVPAERITLSSDCNGSLPVFDERGAYRGMRIAGNATLLGDWQRLVREGVLSLEAALPLLGSNVARVLGLEARKGRLEPGLDADITLLDAELSPQRTYVAGRCLYAADRCEAVDVVATFADRNS